MASGGKMKLNLNFNYKRIVLVCVLLLIVLSLSGCGYDTSLNGFNDETNLFGWLLVWPIGWLMNTIGTFFNGSYGIALVLTTVIVRIISWPIYAGSTSSMFKMQLAQPDIARIQSKYAGRTDQISKNKQQAEMQAIYKKHEINPLGCMIMVFQFPIFSAMYTVIKRITVEGGDLTLTNMNLFGFDLTSSLYSGGIGNQIFTGVLVVLVVATMFYSQYLSRKKPSYAKNIPNNNPKAQQTQDTMKMMMYFSPILMGVMASQDAGLALYWVVGNLFQLIQSIVIRKKQDNKYKASKNII